MSTPTSTPSADDHARAQGRSLRIVFYGSDRLAVPCFEGLINAGHKIVALVTEPQREVGNGPDGVAGAWRLPILEPASLKDKEVEGTLKALTPDVQVVAGYGPALPRALLDLAPSGTLKVHPSLLPRYRGAAPVERAIIAGETETGISVIRMEEQPDAGPVLASRSTPIGAAETGGELRARLAEMMAELLVETLQKLVDGSLQSKPQEEEQASEPSIPGPARPRRLPAGR